MPYDNLIKTPICPMALVYYLQKVRLMQMLKYEVAKELYEEISKKAAKNLDEDLQSIYRDFLKNAVDYARNRTEWSFMDWNDRREDGGSRSAKHNAFMAMLGAVCRNLCVEGIDEIMPDRKTKGDFACYITLFLALEQR